MLLAEMLKWMFTTPLSKAVMPPIKQGGAVDVLMILMLLLLFLFIIVLVIIERELRKRGKRLLSERGVKIATAIGVAVFVVATFTALYLSTEPGTHRGDLVISGTHAFTIENCVYTQDGNIIVKDNASLIIKNAEVRMEQSERQHTVAIKNYAELIAEDATITVTRKKYSSGYLYDDFNFSISDHARATIKGTWISSPIHCYDSSQISVHDSTVEVIDHRSIDG